MSKAKILRETKEYWRTLRIKHPVIATAHTDDWNVNVSFNATLWFMKASVADLLRLARCGWANDYPADKVAIFMADFNGNLRDMFQYIEILNRCNPRGAGGFECSVGSVSAMDWLYRNRRKVYDRILKEDDEGG